ncbi:MAG: UbiA family prenyltransferase [Pseudolysinimonas sp.]|uniref:UbiA family prenyltransferase n=1 Tax=Pseudolysinimonas sp. TaxID=2680009 RepID=UPI00326484CD
MRSIGALARSSHPGPVLIVTLIEVLLGIAVGLEPWRVLVLGLTLGFNQLSIGLSNDWIDARRDIAAGRTDKPIARGDVTPHLVRNVALACGGLAIGVSLALGFPFAVAHLIAIAGGWAYNLWLKSSALSFVPYLVSFGLLPLLATLARPVAAGAAWWAIAAGALLGLAAHIANVLPDLSADVATGVRGMPHRVGLRVASVIAGLALAAAALALVVGIGVSPISTAGLALSLAASAASVVFGLRRSRAAFPLVMLAAVMDVVLLVVAGSRMVASPFGG